MNERVTSAHFPYLSITLTVQERTFTVEALIDTGFDGDVIIPASYVGADETPDSIISCSLVDGSAVNAPAFEAEGRLGPFILAPITVIVLGDEPLIGRGIIDRFTIILNHGRQVIVEP